MKTEVVIKKTSGLRSIPSNPHFVEHTSDTLTEYITEVTEGKTLEIDEARLALRFVEPILVGKMDRVIRQVVNEFKHDRLTQEEIVRLKADYDAARSLLSNLTEAAGGGRNG